MDKGGFMIKFMLVLLILMALYMFWPLVPIALIIWYGANNWSVEKKKEAVDAG